MCPQNALPYLILAGGPPCRRLPALPLGSGLGPLRLPLSGSTCFEDGSTSYTAAGMGTRTMELLYNRKGRHMSNLATHIRRAERMGEAGVLGPLVGQGGQQGGAHFEFSEKHKWEKGIVDGLAWQGQKGEPAMAGGARSAPRGHTQWGNKNNGPKSRRGGLWMGCLHPR